MDFTSWFTENEIRLRQDFVQFLRLKSISTDPAYAGECRRTAEWLQERLQKMGMTAVLLENSGNPVVFAEYKRKGGEGPTVLLYQHYDVQPVDPLELWESDPFEPVWKEGKVFARGASDNKGQCFLTLSALEAFLTLHKETDLHIKVFIEGEEESGSRGTLDAIHKYKHLLAADYLCVIDFDLITAGEPAISLGYRGITTLELSCSNANSDLHSGAHGGVALNPLRALSQAFAALWDKNGRVAIPHFYDAVDPFVEEEKKGVDFSFDEKKYKEEFGVSVLCKEDGFSPKEQGTLRPTVEINGLWGGYTGVGFKTVLPAKAQAKLSCRLVSQQDPEEIATYLCQFLREQIPAEMKLDINVHHGAKGLRVSATSRLVQLVSKSLEEVFAKPCRYVLCGGSIPIIAELAEAVQGEVALFGFALSTDNIHAPNEHFRWECFVKGFFTMTRILEKLE